jgi:TIR domain
MDGSEGRLYKCDAFVFDDIEDREWVNERLLPQLEQNSGHQNCTLSELEDVQQTSFHGVVKLCVHERDFPPGQEIIANIWNRLELSRKVVLVLRTLGAVNTASSMIICGEMVDIQDTSGITFDQVIDSLIADNAKLNFKKELRMRQE